MLVQGNPGTHWLHVRNQGILTVQLTVDCECFAENFSWHPNGGAGLFTSGAFDSLIGESHHYFRNECAIGVCTDYRRSHSIQVQVPTGWNSRSQSFAVVGNHPEPRPGDDFVGVAKHSLD